MCVCLLQIFAFFSHLLLSSTLQANTNIPEAEVEEGLENGTERIDQDAHTHFTPDIPWLVRACTRFSHTYTHTHIRAHTHLNTCYTRSTQCSLALQYLPSYISHSESLIFCHFHWSATSRLFFPPHIHTPFLPLFSSTHERHFRSLTLPLLTLMNYSSPCRVQLYLTEQILCHRCLPS